MNNIPNHPHRDLGRGIEFENTEGLLGPIVVVCQQIGDEAARFAQLLGFGEPKIGLLDLRFRIEMPLSANRFRADGRDFWPSSSIPSLSI